MDDYGRVSVCWQELQVHLLDWIIWYRSENQLLSPLGVAINPHGDVYIAEVINVTRGSLYSNIYTLKLWPLFSFNNSLYNGIVTQLLCSYFVYKLSVR